MAYSEAEDAGGPMPAKDDNEAVRHFIRRTLPIFNRVDYILNGSAKSYGLSQFVRFYYNANVCPYYLQFLQV